MPVYYNFIVVIAVIVKTRVMCMYVYYTIVLVTGEPLTWQPQLVVSVTYHPRFRQTKFYILYFPAIRWRSMELQCESVTENNNATVYIRWAYCLQKAKG
jgi:hypothetical protein